MRFLCLHGKGTSAAIFKSQTASFRAKLDSSYSFDFVDAPFPSAPAAGIELFYSGPYRAFWNGTAIKDVRAAHQLLRTLLERDGPYDGVLMFSQGCAVVASFLLYHQAETPHLPLPFKVAIFICGGVPLQIIEELGGEISQQARDVDDRSRNELQQKAASIATVQPGVDRWARPGNLAFDPTASINPANVFGLDFSRIPADLRIKIPTVHVYGIKDPRYPASVQLSQFCQPTLRKTYDHGGGHDIPRGKVVSESIAELVEWSATMANMR
ncbi:hypothetical protein MMC07_003402 [Pseudocyphellaria aurata]|nr:hypothetical protein [Pseudocyphellaria aurata]